MRSALVRQPPRGSFGIGSISLDQPAKWKWPCTVPLRPKDGQCPLPYSGRIEQFGIDNLWTVWPTFLTLAPLLSKHVCEGYSQGPCAQGGRGSAWIDSGNSRRATRGIGGANNFSRGRVLRVSPQRRSRRRCRANDVLDPKRSPSADSERVPSRTGREQRTYQRLPEWA